MTCPQDFASPANLPLIALLLVLQRMSRLIRYFVRPFRGYILAQVSIINLHHFSIWQYVSSTSKLVEILYSAEDILFRCQMLAGSQTNMSWVVTWLCGVAGLQHSFLILLVSWLVSLKQRLHSEWKKLVDCRWKLNSRFDSRFGSRPSKLISVSYEEGFFNYWSAEGIFFVSMSKKSCANSLLLVSGRQF